MSAKKYAKKLGGLTQQLGNTGVDTLAAELDKQADNADEPWKKALVNLAVDGLEKFGPEGVRMASKAVEDLFAGKQGGTKISDITDNLRTASDLLAALQSAEADRKSKARDWLRAIGQVAGRLTAGYIRGLL